MAEQMPPAQRSKQEHKLFSVIGWTLEGRSIALIIAKSEADAEYYALHELGFVRVDGTSLTSDCVHVGPADTMDSASKEGTQIIKKSGLI